MCAVLDSDIGTYPQRAPCRAGLYIGVENCNLDSVIRAALYDQLLRLDSQKSADLRPRRFGVHLKNY